MPQMAPLNWLTLMFYFLFIFYIFNSINYYSFIYKSNFSQKNKKTNSFNWKW
uniref:ATP synthase complex subunit 8 n=1 Tax=Tetratoma fungorum TaxID=296006 RepID=A0A343A443_9CUCU|nr:ATP synthase F0 subunit 8 [Tetratoma fungorum]AOY39321.1 ATP synthase F0 subunit 8 [Tetratoma fungorum]ARH54692.1 ATP synthase F0 subunit 8 [Tetratoma fungorum]